uniref:Uncharacterized protein n=1 Tax=Poecilia reticulata TaxID=8081 RepID=A0A3P9NF34_POERE
MKLFKRRRGQLGQIVAQMDDIRDITSSHEDIGIVLEGIRVVSNLDSVPTAVVILVGLIYGLNLADPADLRYTFEVLQKITMELDGGNLSN